MAIVNMKKMHLVGLKSEQDLILSDLQKIGSLEIIDITAEEQDQEVQENPETQKVTKELSELDLKLNRYKFGIDFLKPYVKEKNPLIYGKPTIDKASVNRLLDKENEVLSRLDIIYELEQELSHLKAEESKINNLIELLEHWRTLDIPLEQLGRTEKTEILPVVIMKKQLEEFENTLAEQKALYELIKVGESRDDSYNLLFFHNDCRDLMQETLKQFSVTVQEFPGLTGTAEDIIAENRKRLAEIESERERIRQQSADLSEARADFKVLYDYWSVERDKKTTWLKMQNTQKTFCLTAWVPEPAVDLVRKTVNKITDAVYMDFEEPTDDDDIPVMLSNPRIVEPFELITDLYSPPNPRGMDPNIYMAPFYFVFFGMMLSDAGYGLIMSVLCALALKKMKLAGMGKKLVELLFLGGISTFVWGAIFGGWIGDLIKIKPLWLNPLDDPMAVLILSFAFGVIQIFTGIVLSGYQKVKSGKPADALMDDGLWLIFLTGLIMLIFPQFSSIAKILAIGGAVGLVLTQGRSQKGIIRKFLSGILSLYNVSSYLSDVLSYSRLLALGLATGVIGTVINTMAKLVGVNFIGVILMVIIIIGGHIFNLAINVLGAYVHSSRLQYIEFFGKFYESGGRNFEPFNVKTSYVELKDF